MPFGLTSAPTVFQTLLNDVLQDLTNTCIFIYLNDILILLSCLSWNICNMWGFWITNSLWEWEFHISEVSFLGFIVKTGNIHMAKSKAVLDWPTPSSRNEYFLGCANFYLRFIRKYSSMAAASLLSPPRTPPCGSQQWIRRLVSRRDSHFSWLFSTGAVLSQRSTNEQKLYPFCLFLPQGLPGRKGIHQKAGASGGQAGPRGVETVVGGGKAAIMPVWTDLHNMAYICSAKQLHSRQAILSFFNRFNFSLSYCQGFRNVKPDTLSHQFQPENSPTCVICAVSWAIDNKVKQSHAKHPAPSTCPTNLFFVPANLHSRFSGAATPLGWPVALMWRVPWLSCNNVSDGHRSGILRSLSPPARSAPSTRAPARLPPVFCNLCLSPTSPGLTSHWTSPIWR